MGIAVRACPSGWRLPNNIDYNRLIQFYKAPKSIGWDSHSTLDFLNLMGLSGWQYDTKIGIYSRWTIGNTRASFVKAGKYWTSEKSEDKNPCNVYVFLGYRDPFPSGVTYEIKCLVDVLRIENWC
ncbi:MAG: hypothetical protein R3B93_09205 [Bacteroidia bacterium]